MAHELTAHQCRFCPWDCPSPEVAPCRDEKPPSMAAEPCDFPAGPLPTEASVEDALRGAAKERRKRSYSNVLRDLGDWEDQ